MRYSTLAVAILLPVLTRAVDFQITNWSCTNSFENGEFEVQNVRVMGQTGCGGGCAIASGPPGDGDDPLATGNPLYDCDYAFSWVVEDNKFRFTTTSPDGTRSGTCVDAYDANDECQQVLYVCSIGVWYDCTYDAPTPVYIPPPANPNAPTKDTTLKFMVAGDSISHGMEADWTWRFRLYAWLQSQGYKPKFVGPFGGTHGPPSANSLRPAAPLLPGEVAPTTDQVVGLYASGVPGEFGSSGHASFWGRQAMQTKDTIHEWVAEYQPDYLLILLGFNDLGWFVSGPEGLLGTMGTLIENAREAKSDIKILMANVVDRFFINGRDDLVENTLAYNNMLRSTYSNWVRLESPLSYVELNANYQCRPDACPDGYDGLHPNSMGEYHIAEAFARSLKADFYFDGDDFVVPSNPEARVVSTPTGVQALQVDEGILATWLADPEARGYEIRSRVQGMTGWWSDGEIGNGNRNYYTWLLDGQTWEFQVCTRGDNDVRSDWGSIASTTAHPKTAPGPPNIVVVPSGDGIQFTWGAVTGYSINRYAVIVWDQDTDGAFISTYGAAGTSFFIGGLVAGHRYSTWVATWVNLSAGPAGGLPVAGRDVIIGGGAPAPPANIQVTNIDPTTVQLTWSGSAGAAGYAIYYRSTSGSSDYTQIGTVTETSEVVGFLFPGTWHYQYCVSAYNGNMESSHTACIIPPVYPGYTKRDELKGDSTVVANTSRVYNSTTMMQDTRLRNMFAKISQNSTILPSL